MNNPLFVWNDPCWVSVMSRLGPTPDPPVLPAVLRCPRCKEDTLHVYRDSLLSEVWHHCRSCGSTGDMISLAAAHWKLDLETVLRQFSNEHLFPSRLDRKMIAVLVHQAERRRQAGEFLKRLSEFPDPRVHHLAHRLSLTLSHEWPLGKMIGFAARCDAASIVGLDQSDCLETALIMPFYTVPGKLSGLWMAHRPNDTEISSEFLSWNAAPKGPSGIGGLTNLLGPPDPLFEDTIFLIDDPLVTLRLQDRHLTTAHQPLPVGAVVADEQPTGLDSGVLNGRRVICCSFRSKISVVRIAASVDGRVTFLSHVSDDPLHHISRFTPKTWLGMVRDESVPWEMALERILSGMATDEIENGIRSADLTPAQEKRFADYCSPQLSDRILSVKNLSLKVCDLGTIQFQMNSGRIEIRYKRYAIWETKLNFTVNIDSVLTVNNCGSYYCGLASYGGRTHRFQVRTSMWLEDLMKGMRRAGFPVQESGRRTSLLLDYILSLSRQDLLVEDATFGWNEARAAWVFQRFSITVRGELEEGRYRSRRKKARSLLPRPRPLMQEELKTLSSTTSGNRVGWAFTASLAIGLIAPQRLLPRVVIDLQEGSGVERWAKKMNTTSDRVGRMGVNWPSVRVAPTDKGSPTNCLVRGPSYLDVDRDRISLFRQVLSTFLLWFAKNGSILNDRVPFEAAVVESLVSWLKSIGARHVRIRNMIRSNLQTSEHSR